MTWPPPEIRNELDDEHAQAVAAHKRSVSRHILSPCREGGNLDLALQTMRASDASEKNALFALAWR